MSRKREAEDQLEDIKELIPSWKLFWPDIPYFILASRPPFSLTKALLAITSSSISVYIPSYVGRLIDALRNGKFRLVFQPLAHSLLLIPFCCNIASLHAPCDMVKK